MTKKLRWSLSFPFPHDRDYRDFQSLHPIKINRKIFLYVKLDETIDFLVFDTETEEFSYVTTTHTSSLKPSIAWLGSEGSSMYMLQGVAACDMPNGGYKRTYALRKLDFEEMKCERGKKNVLIFDLKTLEKSTVPLNTNASLNSMFLSKDNGKLLLFDFTNNTQIVSTIENGEVVEVYRGVVDSLDRQLQGFRSGGVFYTIQNRMEYHLFDLMACQWKVFDVGDSGQVNVSRHLKIDGKIYTLAWQSSWEFNFKPRLHYRMLELDPKLSTICFCSLVNEQDVKKVEDIKKRLPFRLRDKLENQIACRKAED